MDCLALVEFTSTANPAPATRRALRLATVSHRRVQTLVFVTFACEVEEEGLVWQFCTEATDD